MAARPAPRRPGAKASVGGRQHVWLALMPWWHAAFVGVLAVTSAYDAVEVSQAWRLVTVLSLYGALAVLYLVTPRKFDRCRARDANLYLVGGFALYVAASFVFPGTGFLLFILIPQCFMLLELRPAYVAMGGLIVVNGAADLGFSGTDSQTVGGVAFFGVASIVLAVLLGGYISRIIVQSAQRAELIEELERARAEVVELSTEAGALAERERLAREIHDALAQGFTSVILLLQAAQAALDRDDITAARHQLALAEPAAREGLAEARSLIAALVPLPLQGASLASAMQRVCTDLGARFNFHAELTVVGEPRPLSRNSEIVLLRAAQEALVNVGRHAGARSAVVELCFEQSTTSLTVTDDGQGFDTSRPDGFGLRQLRSKVEELGGRAEILAAPGAGTRVRAELPDVDLVGELKA